MKNVPGRGYRTGKSPEGEWLFKEQPAYERMNGNEAAPDPSGPVSVIRVWILFQVHGKLLETSGRSRENERWTGPIIEELEPCPKKSECDFLNVPGIFISESFKQSGKSSLMNKYDFLWNTERPPT